MKEYHAFKLTLSATLLALLEISYTQNLPNLKCDSEKYIANQKYPNPSLPDHFMPFISFPLERKLPSKDLEKRRRLQHAEEIAPLYQGLGVHYSYIWVGTPPQRVSVIVDTGSHHTAFPCTGCKCGKHADPYWDPKRSKTSSVLKCGRSQCTFSQSYTEGSSWKAYKVKDFIWLGGPHQGMMASASKYKVEFTFGCQSSESGLFRTQNVDGIMGMAASPHTLPHQLFVRNITRTKTFAMCFSVGDGMLTIGGVDQSIHTGPTLYARSLKRSGWYTVRVLEILMVQKIDNDDSSRSNTSVILHKLEIPASRYNAGKGTIIDSGTTDTYLPSSAKSAFNYLFHKLSGVSFLNTYQHINAKQMAKLPDLLFRLLGVNDDVIEIYVPIDNFIESNRNKRAFRIFLTENDGAVLGANFMSNQNVIFDVENDRIGFAPSTCKYSTWTSSTPSAPIHAADSNEANPMSVAVEVTPLLPPSTEYSESYSNLTGSDGLPPVAHSLQSGIGRSTARGAVSSPFQTTPVNRTTYCGHVLNYARPITPCSADCTAVGAESYRGNASGPTVSSHGPKTRDKGYVSYGHQIWQLVNSKAAALCEGHPVFQSLATDIRSGITGEVVEKPRDVSGRRGLSQRRQGTRRAKAQHTPSSHPTPPFRRRCAVSCDKNHDMVSGSPDCPTSSWGSCDATCLQHRTVGRRRPAGTVARSVCVQVKEQRPCHIHGCAMGSGDQVVGVDLKVRMERAQLWYYGRTEDLIAALCHVLGTRVIQVPDSSARLAGDPVVKPPWLKLHIRLRIRPADLGSYLPDVDDLRQGLGTVMSISTSKSKSPGGPSNGSVVAASTGGGSVVGEVTDLSFLVVKASQRICDLVLSNKRNVSLSVGEALQTLRTAQSDWLWLRQGDVVVSGASVMPMGRAILYPRKDDMSMRLDLADLTIAWLISGRSLWALCCALSIFIFAYSTYFFLLLRSRGRCPDDGVLTPRSLQEVLKIHDAVMRERIRSGKI